MPSSVLLPLTSLALLILILSRAWVGEDALITFRTIDQLVHGHGLRWNVDERVQTYTHPLWMLLNALAYFFTREVYTTTAVLGAGSTLGAYWALAHPFRRRPVLVLTAVFAPLCLSASAIRYATSGYENSLTLLLLAIFAGLYLREPGRPDAPWGRLVLTASLAAVNRLDAVLLLLPALLALGVSPGRRVPVGRVLLAASPLVAWLGFSLLYYGFPLPNTAPAKLSDAIPFGEYLVHGLAYGADLLQADLASALVLLAGIGIAVDAGVRAARDRRDVASARLAALGLGLAPYTVYVVSVGGGFLSGRFWVAPVLLSIALLVWRAEAAWRGFAAWPSGRRAAVAGAGLLVALLLWGLGRQLAPWTASHGILELPFARASLGPDGRWALSPLAERFREVGRDAARQARRGEGRPVAVMSAIGFAGLAAGRDVVILDRWALADPLLARLSPSADHELRIGHLLRELPAGYERARRTGSLDGLHPALRRYYAKLRLVVAGRLWSGERLAAIAGFQLGRYDAWLREYERDTGRGGGRPTLRAWPAGDRAR